MATYVSLSREDKEGIIVFNIKGKLDETNTDDIFSNINKSIGDFEGKKVILSFYELEYLNSKTIGYIVNLFSVLIDNSGVLYLSDCDEKIYDILELTGVIAVIPYSKTEKEAIEELK